MVEPIAASTATALSMIKVLNKPLTDLYEYLKQEGKFKLDKSKIEQKREKLFFKINNLNKVKTIYKGDEAIDLNEFFYPPKLVIDQSELNSGNLDLNSEENIVIQGIAGQGKSILLRYLAVNEAKKDEKIPLFLELRKINKEGDILNFIKKNIEDIVSNVTDDLFKWVLSSGKIILFLDGFDELNEADVVNIIKDLEYISENFPNTKIIVTSRPDSGIQASNYFKIIDIKPYIKSDQIGLIRILVEEDESYNNIVTALERSSLDIEDLLSTPLMITMFVMIYRAKLIIPDTISKFYQDLFSVLVYKHDRTKPGYVRNFQSNLDEVTLQEWFELFCFQSKAKNKISFESRSDIISYISSSLINKFSDESPINILNDINKNLCLIIKDGGNFSFIHKTIQEYYTSCYIKNRNEDVSKKIYEKICIKPHKYKSELLFLEQIDKYRFNKYLLIPALREFFNIFYNYQVFKESISIISEAQEIDNEIFYNNTHLGIFVNDLPLYNKFLGYLLNTKNFHKSTFGYIHEVMQLGEFGSFGHHFEFKINESENITKYSKCTKFFMKNAEVDLKSLYDEIKEDYQAALQNIKFEEDLSMLDIFEEENPL